MTKAARLVELCVLLAAIVGPQIPQAMFAHKLSGDEACHGLAGAAISGGVLAAYKLWKRPDGLCERLNKNTNNGKG